MMTKSELSKYFYLSLEIRSLENKIKEIKNRSVGISRITGMPLIHSTTSQIERQVILLSKLKEKLESKKIDAIEEMLKIETYLSSIEDPEARLILNKRYIELKRWEVIAREMSMSESTVFRKHREYVEGKNE